MAPIDFSKLDLRDALDLAILVEEEAQHRYEQFSKVVGGRTPGDAADVFRGMAGNEAKHGAQLADRRRKLFGDTPRRLSADLLDDAEAPDRGRPRVFMSARQAMEIAIESEEKARDFFEDAARGTDDPDVRKLFQELQREEVLHRALLAEKLAKLPEGPDLGEEDADEPGSDPG
jgi:erythrin-vacuolar iron transport family protein